MTDDLPPNVNAYKTKRGIVYRFIPPRSVRGKMKSVTLGFNRDKAVKMGAALSKQAARMTDGGAKEVAGFYRLGTLAHLAYDYFSSRYFMKVSASSQAAFRSTTKSILKFPYKGQALGDWSLELITSREADKIITAIEDEVGWPTVITYHAMLRRLFYVGIRLDMVDRNPFSKMGMKLPLPRGVFWTGGQMQQVLTYCKQTDMRDFALYFRLLYETAMRPVDVVSLRIEDFDFSSEPVTVSCIQQKTQGQVDVPISAELSSDVLDYCNISGYLFSPNRDRKWVQDNFYATFNKIKKDLGLPEELLIRDLRRTAALEAAQNGATDRELIALTGHSTPKMLNVYAPRNLKQAAEAQRKRGLINGPMANH